MASKVLYREFTSNFGFEGVQVEESEVYHEPDDGWFDKDVVFYIHQERSDLKIYLNVTNETPREEMLKEFEDTIGSLETIRDAIDVAKEAAHRVLAEYNEWEASREEKL